MNDCVFCKIVNGEMPAEVVVNNDKALAFLDIHPVNPGHMLVIPKTHEDKIYELDTDYYQAVMELGKNMAKRIEDAFDPVRVGMMVHGFDVPHAHLHVVPMHKSSDLQVGKKSSVAPDDLEAVAEKLRK